MNRSTSWVTTIFFYAGFALILAGLWLIYPPLALIGGGVFLMVDALACYMVAKTKESEWEERRTGA